jgi:hypothetical protein
MKKIYRDELKTIIDTCIVELKIDGQPRDPYSIHEATGEVIELKFSNQILLRISTEDWPHFFGEADLIVIVTTPDDLIKEDLTSKFNISKIRIWQWKPMGIALFNPGYFSQIELFHREKILLSIGFFKSTDTKTDFLASGDLYIQNSAINPIDLKTNLGYEDFE